MEPLDRISKFIEMDIGPGELDGVGSLEDQMIRYFDGDQLVFKRFLYRMIEPRLRAAVRSELGKESFEDTTPVKEILDTKNLITQLEKLSEATGFRFADLKMSFVRRVIFTLLFVIPFFGLLYLIATNFIPSLLAIVFEGWGVLLVALFLPAVVVYMIFPRLMTESKLDPSIVTYHDLVMDLVLMNRISFVENDYARTRVELRRIAIG